MFSLTNNNAEIGKDKLIYKTSDQINWSVLRSKGIFPYEVSLDTSVMLFLYQDSKEIQDIVEQINNETIEIDETVAYGCVTLWKACLTFLKILEKYYRENLGKAEKDYPNIRISDQNLIHVLTFRNTYPTGTKPVDQIIVFEFEFSKLDEIKSFLFKGYTGNIRDLLAMRTFWRKSRALLKHFLQ